MRFETHLAHFVHQNHPRYHAVAAIQPERGEPRYHRGNLYVLIELMGESPVKGQVLRRLQEVIQGTYYTAGGPVSSILNQAILEAHATLQEMNRSWPDTDLRAGITCAALVEDHLVVAGAGPGLVLVATGDRVDQFPPDPSYYKGPIGGESPPEVHIYRHRAQDGDVLFLGESDWILLTDIRRLGGAVATTEPGNRFDVVEYLHQEAKSDQVLGLLVVLSQPEPRSTAMPKPVRTLPTALGATPPVRIVPETPEASFRERQEPMPPAPPIPSAPDETGGPPTWEPPEAQVAAQTKTSRGRASFAARLRMLERRRRFGWRWWNALRASLAAWLPRLLPDRRQAPISWAEPPSTEETSAEPAPPRSPLRPVATPPSRTRGRRARIFLLLAVLIPLLAFGAVLAAILGKGNANVKEATQLVDRAEGLVLLGEEHLDAGNADQAWDAFNQAQRLLDTAISYVGTTDRIDALRQRIALATKRLLRVRTLYTLDPPLITRFPPDANPYRVLTTAQDVYILDRGRQLVELYRTDATRAAVRGQPVTVIQAGANVDGQTVGNLVDMAWEPKQAGILDKASLLILDDRNQIWRYNEVDGLSRIAVGVAEDAGLLQQVTQLATYAGRLYLADEGADQIFRYEIAKGQGYATPAYAWFQPAVQVDLRGLLDMEIDSDIWLLTENGQLLRYRQGQQQPFQLEQLAALQVRYVDLALNVQPTGRIYLADASQDRVVVFAKDGTYLEVLQGPEPDLLRGLRGLDVDEDSGILFLVTQTSLYAAPLAE